MTGAEDLSSNVAEKVCASADWIKPMDAGQQKAGWIRRIESIVVLQHRPWMKAPSRSYQRNCDWRNSPQSCWMKERVVPTQGPMISYAALGRLGMKKDFRYFKALRHDLFYRALAHRGRLPLLTLGDVGNHFAWQVCPEKLGENSTVVSAGVGRDISFELALVRLFNCRILLLDPSPTGISTMALTKNQHPNIQFLPLALTGRDGPLTMGEPRNPEEGSYSSLVGASQGPIVEGISLSSLMNRYGLERIDLLKIDIEGSEFGVIESILREKIKITQICVEYHNQVLPGIKTSWTAGSLLRLWFAGWRLISKWGSNHTLWNDRFAAKD